MLILFLYQVLIEPIKRTISKPQDQFIWGHKKRQTNSFFCKKKVIKGGREALLHIILVARQWQPKGPSRLYSTKFPRSSEWQQNFHEEAAACDKIHSQKIFVRSGNLFLLLRDCLSQRSRTTFLFWHIWSRIKMSFCTSNSQIIEFGILICWSSRSHIRFYFQNKGIFSCICNCETAIIFWRGKTHSSI